MFNYVACRMCTFGVLLPFERNVHNLLEYSFNRTRKRGVDFDLPSQILLYSPIHHVVLMA